MEDIKKALIEKAKDKYKNIWPCNGATDFSKSFSIHRDKLILWFNTEDKSTKVIMTDIV